MTPGAPMRGQAGFSLLEVLVAFSILALSLGVLLQIFSTGLRGVSLSSDYTRAVLLAESKLAAAGREGPVASSGGEGVEDETYHWSVSVRPYGGAGGGTVVPYEVTVEVWWNEGERERRVQLTSVRLEVQESR